ncbi:MAG: sigma 54-interacting transcriptional regulator [Polyangiaceae bacterium]
MESSISVEMTRTNGPAIPFSCEAAAPRDATVAACLTALLDELDADRALLFLGRGRTLAPWIGRSRAGRLDRLAMEDVSRGVVERASFEQREIRSNASFEEGSRLAPTAAIVSAWARPVGSWAVLYVDFRDVTRLGESADARAWSAAHALLTEVLGVDEIHTSRADSPPVESLDESSPSLEELLALPGQRALRDDVSTALLTELPVLVTGETGTGKTLLACALAERMGRKAVVRAMLGASDDLNTIGSELFGHEKGAFSGAASRRVGLVEHAHGGVLILDEIVNLPLGAQQLLLDLVQFGAYRPLGHAGASPRRAELRIIAVTNGDLEAAVNEGRFRRDLFHRLAGVHLRVEPLRARRGDIPGLAASLLASLTREDGSLARDARLRLLGEDLRWDGNTRELEAVLRRAAARVRLRTPSGPFEIRAFDLEAAFASAAPLRAAPTSSDCVGELAARWSALHAERAELDRRESALIDEAMRSARGVVTRAARSLGIARTTLASRLAARSTADEERDA